MKTLKGKLLHSKSLKVKRLIMESSSIQCYGCHDIEIILMKYYSASSI